jgi:beta-amylase
MAISSIQVFRSLRPPNASSTATAASSLRNSQTLSASLRVSFGFRSSVDFNSCGLKGCFVPSSARSRAWAMAREREERTEDYPLAGDSVDAVDDKQVTL